MSAGLHLHSSERLSDSHSHSSVFLATLIFERSVPFVFGAFRDLGMADSTSSVLPSVRSPGLYGRACEACSTAKAKCVPSTGLNPKCQRLCNLFPRRHLTILGSIASSQAAPDAND